MKAVLGFAFLLILEIVIFCLVRKRSKHVLTIVFVLLWLITLKFIVFPPVSGIPTHGSYEIAYEDNWVTEDVMDPYTNAKFRQLQIRKWYPVDCDELHPVIIASHTYIEKDSSINDEIDRLRLSATASLTERRDVIVVASVSCIYGLGSPKEFKAMAVSLRRGQRIDRDDVIRALVNIQYNRKGCG